MNRVLIICGSAGRGGVTETMCQAAAEVFRANRLFGESDLVVLATPLHFSGPSSLLKTVLDRFQAYWHDKVLPHPLACCAMLCAGSPEPNFAPTVSILRAFSITTKMKWMGHWMGHMEFPDTDARGDEGAADAVRGFIEGILASRDSLSAAQLWPPCSQGSE